MRFISTRGGVPSQIFEDTLLSGFAKDGGIFIPEVIPAINSTQLKEWSKLSYVDLAVAVCSLFIDDKEVPRTDLKEVMEGSFTVFPSEIVPVVPVGKKYYVAELFHGPTYAFKDLALQFVGNMVNYFLQKRKKRNNIIVSTSGDTGSAAIHAVRGKSNIEIYVLYPKGRITPFQEQQMITALDENVHTLCVDRATSDDLDVVVKNLFDDLPFNNAHNLCTINSINWGRIMIQLVHYFHSYFRVREQLINTNSVANPDDYWPSIYFSVPTGAFGNATAGVLCKLMGLPIERILVATNENDILFRYFTTGVFHKGNVVPTISPAIDIQVPYNFERFLYFLSNSTEQTKQWMDDFKTTVSIDLGTALLKKSQQWILSASVTTEETLNTIRSIYEEDHYLVDPHTAVGIHAVQKLLEQHAVDGTKPFVCLATAHACKFADAIKKAINVDPKPPGQTIPNNKKTKVVMMAKDNAEVLLRQMIIDQSKKFVK